MGGSSCGAKATELHLPEEIIEDIRSVPPETNLGYERNEVLLLHVHRYPWTSVGGCVEH